MGQWLEEIINLIVSSGDAEDMPSFSAMRVLRILRLMRIIRFVRIMRLLGELRALVSAVGSSLKALFWTMVLIALLIYIAAVLFTQMVSDYRLYNAEEGDDQAELRRFFGSIGNATLTLFQAVTGGISWYMITDPLQSHMSAGAAIVFCLYVAFMLFALLNVVTGVFVDTAINKTKEQTDIFMINNVRELFGKCLDREMTWVEFNSKLDLPEMMRYFDFLDVDVSDARALFTLIDTDASGSIDCEEFLESCLRLKGPAKALDHQVLMREVSDMGMQMRKVLNILERQPDREGDTAGKRSALRMTLTQGKPGCGSG